MADERENLTNGLKGEQHTLVDSVEAPEKNVIATHDPKAKNIPSKDLLKNIPWPFEAGELYKIAVRFYKDNVGKAFHPSYEQKNSLVAYTYQERYGRFNGDKAAPLGALDFVGHDRRKAWALLEDMTPSVAQKNFIDLLDCLCPLFRPYVMAIRCDLDEKHRQKLEAEEMEKQKQKEAEELEQHKLEEEAKRKEEEQAKKYEEQKRLIKDILNRQTLNQFTSYAKQQYPDSAELQEHLVAQLQEQHFQQYMQQMSEHTNGTFEVNGERILGANNSTNLEQGNEGDRQPANVNGLREAFGNQLNLNGATDKVDGAGNGHTAGRDEGENEDDLFDEEGDEEEDDEDYDQNKAIANASMWTRQGIATFKNTIVNELNEGVLKIGHGEIATIKVPTHPDGNCLYWEFATDDYDIGFGLLFEWKESPDTQVSIHITESDDDEDDDDFLGDGNTNDIESGQMNGDYPRRKLGTSGDPISIIIPIYRRDCNQEVFAGSHMYPDKGVYHLKFDNSYSLWRSKTIYYRVYYTNEPEP